MEDEQPAVAAVNETPKDQKVTVSRGVRALEVIFLVLLTGIIGFGGGWLGSSSRDSADSSSSAQRVVLDEKSDVISDIAKKVGSSVVSVNVTSQSTDSTSSFFGYGRSVQQQSAGTGIILSKEGLIITNRHVVPEGTTAVSITLSDGTTIDNVKVVGRTNSNDTLDVAFLQIADLKGLSLTPATIGSSSKMRVGDSVVAIGNALGQFQNTVTTGILSGYGRSLEASDESGSGSENLDDLFQTDAAINQGNSGGPLVNLDGEVIGINTAVAGNAENVGFSIPIDNVGGLIASVRDTGTLARPYIGVLYVPLTDTVAKKYNLPIKRGAYIPTSDDYGQKTIITDGPAAKAGVREGDIITKVDGVTVNEQASLASLLGKHQPGETVKLTINRDGKIEKISLKLGTMPNASAN